MSAWPPISRDDLREAARRAGFDTTFPLLVRRLIAETADGLTELDMPGGSGVAAGGFDGVVTASGETLEVPAGTSVWELSVTGNTGSKANTDYGKRATGPDGRAASEITYVQVILSVWTKAREWASEHRSEGRWKDVRAYGVDAVDAWLDRAPATTAWLAEQLGKTLPGVRSAGDWLDRTWSPSTRIPLDDQVVLAGRDVAAAALLAVVRRGQSVIAVSGELTVDEFHAVVVASLRRDEQPHRDHLEARVLLAWNEDSIAQLVAQPQPLVLVLADPRLTAQLPADHSHQLIVRVPNDAGADVVFEPVDPQSVSGLLRAAGEPWDRAGRLGALARRSVSALRRSLALHPASLGPVWADDASVLRRRLVLLGAWEGTNPADRQAVGEVCGRPYLEVEDAALSMAVTEDLPMLGRHSDSWYLLAPEDAWMLLSAHLTRDDLSAFTELAPTVLTEPDPFFGMDGVERFSAQHAGIRRAYSSALRTGLATTLALLGATDSPSSKSSPTGSDVARRTVQSILAAANADSTYAVWSGLRDVLKLLAEAAPAEFLEAMREGLKSESPLHARMFTDSADDHSFFAAPPSHAEFLWALEVLAWSPDYVDDVIEVLSRLADLDPGGRYSNRPLRSLADIFSCWKPATNASADQRFEALGRLLRTYPELTRSLLVTLIPDGQGTQMSHPHPRFGPAVNEPRLTRADVAHNVAAVVDLLLDDLGSAPERFLPLISRVDHLPPTQRDRFVRALVELAEVLDEDGARATLHDALVDKVAHHREYADAVWAMPEDVLDLLEQAAIHLAPRGIRLAVARLFASAWISLGDVPRHDDLDAYDSEVLERRGTAVGQVLAEEGLDGLAELAAGTDFPHLVGLGLAAHSAAFDEKMLVWLQEDRPRHEVAYAYLSSRLRADADLLDRLLNDAPDAEAQATLLRATGDPEFAVAKIAEFGESVTQAYWRKFSPYGLGHGFDAVHHAASGLLSVGRNAAALCLLSLYSGGSHTEGIAEAAATACERLLSADPPDPELGLLSSHDLGRIVQLLHGSWSKVGLQRVVNIEWNLFPGLGFQSESPALHEALSVDPTFFVELVEYVYRSEIEGESSAETADEARLETGRRAREVLQSWRRPPGAGPDGVLDGDRLEEWITSARALLQERHRLRVGDSEIGRILAHALPDKDELSPPVAVRDLIEKVASDDLDQGLETELFNRRGITTRGVYDGGDQERELAATYSEAAQKLRSWPRTRRVLRSLADGYESDARHHDEDAERRRRGLDS